MDILRLNSYHVMYVHRKGKDGYFSSFSKMHGIPQSMMNTKLGQVLQSGSAKVHCNKNGLIKTIQIMPCNLMISEFQIKFPSLWIKAYPGLS